MTPGRRLYEIYASKFKHRWGGRIIPFNGLSEQERSLWELVALDFWSKYPLKQLPRKRKLLTFLFCSWKG